MLTICFVRRRHCWWFLGEDGKAGVCHITHHPGNLRRHLTPVHVMFNTGAAGDFLWVAVPWTIAQRETQWHRQFGMAHGHQSRHANRWYLLHLLQKYQLMKHLPLFDVFFYTVRCRLRTHLVCGINCDLRYGVVDTEVCSVGCVNYYKRARLQLHKIQEIYKKKICMPLYSTFAVAECFPTEKFARFVFLSLELIYIKKNRKVYVAKRGGYEP